MKKTDYRKLLIGVVAVLLLGFLLLGKAPGYLNPETLTAWLEKAGWLAPFLYLGIMALTVVTPLPTLPLNIAAGIVFGPYLGTFLSATGAMAGAAISFLIARLLGRELIERFLRGHINFCTACSNKLLTGLILLTRLVPVVSFDLISYGAGLTKISLRLFCLATFLGMLPLTFAYNYFGAILIGNKILPVSLGLLMVLLFFTMPVLIERYNLFSLRRLFADHLPENHPEGGNDQT